MQGHLLVLIGQLLALVGIGVLLRESRLLPVEAPDVLNKVILYAAFPAFVLAAVHRTQLRLELLVVPAIAWAVMLTVLLLAWATGRMTRSAAPLFGAFVLASTLGNTGYLGYPVTQVLLGPDALVRSIFYDVVGSVGVLLTFGVAIASRMGEREQKASLAREALAFPAVISLIVALLLKPVPIPEPVTQLLEMLARTVVPLVMISLGLSLRARALGENKRLLAGVVALKLVISPAIALGIGMLVLRDAAVLRTVILEAGMPSMMMVLVFGQAYRLDTDFIASAILVTTALSALTVPIFQWVVRFV